MTDIGKNRGGVSANPCELVHTPEYCEMFSIGISFQISPAQRGQIHHARSPRSPRQNESQHAKRERIAPSGGGYRECTGEKCCNQLFWNRRGGISTEVAASANGKNRSYAVEIYSFLRRITRLR
jgi:hypothetical protein